MHADTVPCLVTLADEFDELGPKRDHASDGSIGDQDHAERSSNHNRDDTPGSSTPQTDSDGSPDIRAIDTDDSGPWINGFTMQKGVDFIVSRCRSGVENRLVEVIYNGLCAYASSGWVWKKYTGSNQHTEHAHFGAKADTGKLENDTRPWGLVEKWGDHMDFDETVRASKQGAGEWWADEKVGAMPISPESALQRIYGATLLGGDDSTALGKRLDEIEKIGRANAEALARIEAKLAERPV